MKTKITSNILEDISRRIQGGINSGNGEKAIVVFNGSNIRLDKSLAEIKILKQRGLNISLGFSFMADKLLDTNKIINTLRPMKVYSEEDIFNLNKISKEYSILVGPNITINTLSKVSLGMIDSFVPSLIWTFLYQGKKVYLDFTSVRQYLGEETKNKEILKIVENHIETVKNMGAMEINKGAFREDFSTLDKKSIKNLSISAKNQKKVLTESDILSISSNTNLILEKGTILTPLARDKAKEKNIIIEFK